MPPRRKPTSTRQKKADIQLKRAIKRGDVPAPETKKVNPKRRIKVRVGPTGVIIGARSDVANADAINAARKLQSAFITLPPQFLESTKLMAATLPLPRPIPSDVAVFEPISDDGVQSDAMLTCPRRPKWRFDMTKKEVERNEEGLFTKWLSQTDELVQSWQDRPAELKQHTMDSSDSQHQSVSMPRAPTYFERNLEVWRQLWRVTEISQIILVLLDSRCPLLHYPPSLVTYLADRKVILVLTKVDIAGPARAEAWSDYLRKNYPGSRIVQVESYIEKEAGSAHQGRKHFEPHLPRDFRERLVEAVREVHAELMEPPEIVKTSPARLQHWKSPVKREIDWIGVLNATGTKVGSAVGGAAVPRPKDGEGPEQMHGEQEPEYLTIGLIGQPNVGKSSLLNALFGMQKVRASKTPGKTKHFQTLFWTPDVRLVDCPGLVMPNFVPMEMQVLSGILPISRVSAVPACIFHASQLLPIEQIYKLTHPELTAPSVEDKRTWRDGMRVSSGEGNEKGTVWTAMDVLTAYADAKGWVTAKAGRSDIHRAGNAILRALAEGKVGWAFWPPGTDKVTVASESSDGTGIWIPQVNVVDEESEESDAEDNSDDEGVSDVQNSEVEVEEDDYEEDSEEDNARTAPVSRFGALAVDDIDAEDED